MSSEYSFKLTSNHELNKLLIKLESLIAKHHQSKFILCNPSLYISRNHPEYLEFWGPLIYRNLKSRRYPAKVFFMILKNVIKILLIIPSEILQHRVVLRPKKSVTSPDYLLVSHYVDSIEDEEDFYFGSVVRDLLLYNKSVTRVLICPRNLKKRSHNSVPTLFLNHKISLLKIIKFIAGNLVAILQLFNHCARNDFSFIETLIIIRGQTSNFSNFRFHTNFEKILIDLNPKNLLITFEGNPIERIIFSLSHKYEVKCFGFQHAPIIKDQVGIFRPLTSNLEPDFILTSGPYMTDKFHNLRKDAVPILTFGSPKCNLNLNTCQNSSRLNNILLVPDGNKNSVNLFYQIGNVLANKYPLKNVVIRSHPHLNTHLNKIFRSVSSNQAQNFNLSSNPLIYDLDSSHWVIYQNSSVSIQAIFRGCEIIHIQHELANIDPLFDMNNYHFSVKGVSDLIKIFDTRYVSSSLLRKSYKTFFAMRYFSPLNSSLLLKIESNLNL